MEAEFCRLLDEADARNTIAYFWPDPPAHLVKRARDAGFITVREMINCFRGTAKRVLDRAYSRLDMPPAHDITEESVIRERQELSLYDYVLASNSEVESSLLEAGIQKGRILRTSFGWEEQKFRQSATRAPRNQKRALFVGTLSVRKGVPDLLDAWERCDNDAELLFVGEVEASFKKFLRHRGIPSNVKIENYTRDVQDLYSTSSVFVFPSLEEGGPQVIYEAAACGMPLIATRMGGGRLLKHRVNGVLVDDGDVSQLAAAINEIFGDLSLRNRLGLRAQSDAEQFTNRTLGQQRASLMLDLIKGR